MEQRDQSTSEKKGGIWKKILLYCLIALFSLFTLLTIALKLYLASPYPTKQLARLLTTSLGQRVKIYTLRTSGGNLEIKGLTIANPPDFPAGNLATAESLTIAPQWRELLAGRRSLRLIELEGVKIELAKDKRGRWNFAAIQKALKKPGGPAEAVISRLLIRDGLIRLNGEVIANGIRLSATDIASKGSRTASLDLGFQDAGRNSYHLSGQVKPGPHPAFHLRLEAPSVSLANLAKAFKSVPLKQGQAALLINARLNNELLSSEGSLDFDLPASAKFGAMAGRMKFSTDYNMQQDLAHLQKLTMEFGDLIRLSATGTVKDVRSKRSFETQINLQEVALKKLNAFLPEELRRQLVFAGRLYQTRLTVTGNAGQGLTSLTGKAQLRDGALAREGQQLISGLCSDIELFRDQALNLKGNLSLCGNRDKATLEAISAPFQIALSPKLKLLRADLPSFSAKVSGHQVIGSASFDASAAEPLTASLQIPKVDLVNLNPLVAKHDLAFSSGTGSVDIKASGQGSGEMKANLSLQVAGLKAIGNNIRLGLDSCMVKAEFRRKDGRLSLSGDSDFNRLAYGDKPASGRFAFSYADQSAILENGIVEWDRIKLRFPRLTWLVRNKKQRDGASYLPINLELAGAEVTRGAGLAKILSSRINGYYVSADKTHWLEGTATAAAEVAWQGEHLGAPTIAADFSRRGANGTISGTILHGQVKGDFAFNPFAASEGATFRFGIKDAVLAGIGRLFPHKEKGQLSDGRLTADLLGSYKPGGGINGHFEAMAKELKVTGSNKTLLSDGGLSLTGEITSQRVTLQQAVLRAGPGVSLQLQGEMDRVFTADRTGSLTFNIPQTPCNTIVDNLVNLMPRALQEGTLEGSVAGEGSLVLQKGQQLLNGVLSFRQVGLEAPDQKVVLRKLDGRFPFSVDLAGKQKIEIPQQLSYSRQNYPQLLQKLNQPFINRDHQMTAERIAFGPVELERIVLLIRAKDGLTEVASLRANLFEGVLLGNATLSMKPGLRADLLVNDISLRALCDRFPGIKGYISGKVDGIVGLSAEKAGMKEVIGFSEFWTRKGKNEQMLVSREFLQRLAGKKLSGFFFRQDRAYDKAEISAILEEGYLTFATLDIENTNLMGMRDLSVSIEPSQNRIAIDHLLEAIKQAATSGKAVTNQGGGTESMPETEFKWQE